MKLGYLTGYSKEAVHQAKALGFDCLELNGWFSEDASSVKALEESREEALEEMQRTDVTYSALALYGNSLMAEDSLVLSVFERMFLVARFLQCDVIAAMTGRDGTRSIDENMPLLKRRWSLIAKAAEDHGMKIAFEPYPGGITGYGPYGWINCATTPLLWERLFDQVPSPALGLEYDPSHLLWQEIDYLQAVRDFGDRIYHVHAKDTAVDKDRLARCGVHGPAWWRFTIPGDGLVDWKALFENLGAKGYEGAVVIEHEDTAYSGDRFAEGLEKGRDFLRAYVPAP